MEEQKTLTKTFAFRVSKKTYKKFKKILKETDKAKSDLLREIIIEYIRSTNN